MDLQGTDIIGAPFRSLGDLLSWGAHLPASECAAAKSSCLPSSLWDWPLSHLELAQSYTSLWNAYPTPDLYRVYKSPSLCLKHKKHFVPPKALCSMWLKLDPYPGAHSCLSPCLSLLGSPRHKDFSWEALLVDDLHTIPCVRLCLWRPQARIVGEAIPTLLLTNSN